MKLKNRQLIVVVTLIAALVGVVGLLALPVLVQAGPDLPPRNPPNRAEADDDDDDGGALIGAYIVLQAQGGSWAGVQWQDEAGTWRAVEGWQGSLSPDGSRRWWVAARDFGRGPFRWVVMTGPGGAVVATSAPFDLPTQANQTVLVTAPSN